MWPSEELAGRLYNIANIGLIVGGVLAVASTVLVVWMGNAKEEYLSSHLRAVNVALAAQEERAAIAERQLLQERQNIANRDITAEDQGALSEKLKSFAGQRATIDVFPITFEHAYIAQTIFGILLNAHWRVDHIGYLSSPVGAPLKPLIVQGIWVQSTEDEPSRKAAEFLFDSLKTTVASGGLSREPLPKPKDHRVWVYVGDKPMPLRSWVK